MKRLLLALLAIAFLCPRLQAQNVEGQIIASQFGSYRVPGIATGSLQFEPATCQVTGGGKNFAAFTTGVPVKIVDSNPALNEIDTPSNVFISQCAISMSTSHIHATPFYLTSGTGGLQEAIINGPVRGGGPNTIILNADWYAQVSPGSPSAVIAAVTGNTNLGLVDVTTTPYTTYRWNGSQYVINTVTGATIPSTTLVLKGGNALGVAQAATPGTDYVIPTGSVASLNAASALPNNTTATTQATSDSSTKVATDAFVLANAGGASAPATTNVYKGNGTLNGIVPATPGTDYLNNSAIPSATGLLKASGTAGLAATAVVNVDYMSAVAENFFGLVPVSNGGGNSAYTWQTVPLSYGTAQDQYVQQAFNNIIFSTLRVTSLNKDLYADGFAGYAGIGVAPIAWNNTLGNEPICQAVTYGGSNYIAVDPTNTGVTPGTAFYVWVGPLPNNAASTPVDCAYYSGEAYKHQQHSNVKVHLGAATYPTNGLIDFVDGNSFDDQYAVSLMGCGKKCSVLSYTGSASVPVVQRPTGGANFAYIDVTDMTITGNYAASSILDIDHLNDSIFMHLSLEEVAVGADHSVQIPASGGGGFQVFMDDVVVTPNVPAQPNAAAVTANIGGGLITSFTVTASGTPFYANGAACTGGYKCVVSLLGTQNGTAGQPCSTMPTGGMVPTFSGGGLVSITAPTGESGCVGPIDVQVYQTFPVNYGVIWHASDSTIKDLTIYSGNLAGLLTDGGDDVFLHVHPSVIPNGIIAGNENQAWYGTELDTVFNYGFQFTQSFANTGASVTATHGYTPWLLTGSAPYLFTGTTSNVNFSASLGLCDNGKPPDWHEFITQSGPIVTTADWSKVPAGMSVYGNDTTCSEAMGDYAPTLTVGNLTGVPTLAATQTWTGVNTFSNTSTTFAQLNSTGGIVGPTGVLLMGGSSFTPSGSMGTFTGNWPFGTNLTLSNTSTNGQTWNIISAGSGSGSASGDFGFSNGTNWPLTFIDASSAAPFVATLSTGEFGWSTASSGGPSNSAQNAGFSSPSSGVIDADSTTAGNGAAKLNLGSLALTNSGVFSNSANNFADSILVNGCNPTTVFTAVQFTQFLTAGLTSCATAPTNSPGTNYNQTAGGFFVATTTGIGSGAGQSTAVGASDYAILNGGNNALAFGDNPLVQDVNDGATGQQLIGQEIDVQPQKAASAYANSGFNVIGSSIHLYNQAGQGGTYGPAIFVDTHDFGTQPFWASGLDMAIASLCPNCPALNVNALGQATPGANFDSPEVFNLYEMYNTGISEGWTMQGHLNSSTSTAPTADFLQIGHGIGTAPGGQTHSLELLSGINLQLDGSSSGSSVIGVSTTGTLALPIFTPTVLYSAAGTALPSCASGIKGALAVVSDATSPTYMGAYASGGGITTEVICSFNGSTYSWLTH